MKTSIRGYLDVDGVRLHGAEFGNDPLHVLLHGSRNLSMDIPR